MFHSLRSQISLILIALISILLIQVVMSRTAQNQSIKNEAALSDSYQRLGIVYELERGVIDLQRTLLVYKDTGSDSSAASFEELMVEVEGKLEKLLQPQVENLQIEFNKVELRRLSEHLKDFRENFQSVVLARRKTSDSYDQIVNQGIKKLESYIVQQFADDQQLRYRLAHEVAQTKSSLNAYLSNSDAEYVSEFNEHLAIALKLIKSNKAASPEVLSLIRGLKSDFYRLVQLTRGYVFLVNVVMTGSANEFLYVSKAL